MAIYKEFAYVYHLGPYTAFSLRMAELLPTVLEKLGCRPQSMLDLACGEGSFAISQAQMGKNVTGVDASPRMLQIARIKAAEQGVKVQWVEMDMRNLDFSSSFDLVTCWFDSLNYLLELADLEKTFRGVEKALKPGGLFIFDMNTIYGLAVVWQQPAYIIQQDTSEIVEIHRSSFDHDHATATVKITAFIQARQAWQRIDEIHQERGYPLAEINNLLAACGFEVLGCYGSLADLSEPELDSGRVWFVARKGGSPAEAGGKKVFQPDRKRPFKGNKIRKTRN
jgi:ubiquinone/menaquinone biosynthesis C-methylase UbiE